MATIVNIFGKLYTFMRRGQPDPAPENVVENEPIRSGSEAANGVCAADNIEECQEALSLCSDEREPVIVNKELDKVMTDSTASSDWEHIPEVSKDVSKVGASQPSDIPEVLLNGSTLSGTDVDAVYPFSSEAGQLKDNIKETSIKEESTITKSDNENAKNETISQNEVAEDRSATKSDKEKTLATKSNEEEKLATKSDKEETLPTKSDKEDKQGPKSHKEESLATKSDKQATLATKSDKQDKQAPKSDKQETQATKSGKKDRLASKTEKEDNDRKVKESKKGKDKKVCKFFKRGQKCWKGTNCIFLHSKEQKQPDVERPVKSLDEKSFSSYLEYVCKSTEEGVQINSKDLFYKLGYEKGVELEKVGEAIIGQYELAKGRNNWPWVKDARYFAELFFAPDWIDKNLPHRDVKSNRKNRSNKKNKHNPNEHFENPGGLCRDFRLKENPEIETMTANAAGDGSGNTPSGQSSQSLTSNHGDHVGTKTTGKPENVDDFVTDYTEEIIQQAMKMALGDGLSESAIMEVIEEVTSVDTARTPRKHVKLTKLDMNRTPKKRRDQLALGFNYHSDLVVQQSPKTVHGEIIHIDPLQKPRKRPEQLAVSFNYLAEQLVKESPKTETGEVIIEGVTTTPSIKARDQLALGFNYHSDQIVKLISPQKKLENENALDMNAVNKKNDSRTLFHGNCKAHDEVINSTKSTKRSISDTFAVGFSYNSDQIIKESLDEINGNLPNDNIVASLIEDVVIGEGRNIVEVVDDVPVIGGLPAGSVW